MLKLVRVSLGLIIGGLVSGQVLAQQYDNVQIEATKITDSIYMLTGAGGNLGLCVGDDSAFLIDDQFAPLTNKILAAIAEISDKPVQFVLNTHWHGDHTGGNENLAKQGSVIVAHENVRKRMSETHHNEVFGTTTEPAAPGALPQITFDESVTFYMNGEEIHVVHTDPGHTDTDSVVYFESSNVIHAGDLFFNGMFPFVDVSSGGSVDGVIAAAEAIAAASDDETVIIPGHGPMSNLAGLKVYLDMLRTVRDRTKKAIADGMEKSDFIPAKPFADLEEDWGGGFLPGDLFAEIAYDSYAGANIQKKTD